MNATALSPSPSSPPFYSIPQPDSHIPLYDRFTMTTGYTFILSSLYLKTNRLFRIFYAQFKQSAGVLGKLKYTGPKYQVQLHLRNISTWSATVQVAVCQIYDILQLPPTGNALLISFRLSSEWANFVTKHRLSIQIGAKTCKKRVCNVCIFRLSFHFACHRWWLECSFSLLVIGGLLYLELFWSG